MIIIQQIDDILFDLFPGVKQSGNDLKVLKNELTNYYTYGPFRPKVTLENGIAKIEINIGTIEAQDTDYKNVVALSDKGRYEEAKRLLDKLIAANPTNSEYYRIYGQILSEEGNQEEGINFLIDALRWDRQNEYALLMMGNIFGKYKNDVETAMKYYDEAVRVDPENNIAINNIGVTLMQQGKRDQAKKYFIEALKINSDYPNTHYALGIIAELEGDFHSAFFSIVESIKKNSSKDDLFKNSVTHAIEISKKVIGTQIGKDVFNQYLRELEDRCEIGIDLKVDQSLPTAAKFEFAENHSRDRHLIKYNPRFPAVEHLQMHELAHLEFALDARQENLNQLFISTQVHKSAFIKTLEPTIKQHHLLAGVRTRHF